MQISETIRHYRKMKNMTQEEMANRLGVTAPAVNKWEKGSSLPDITLLAPIARLLGITVDTLLSFRDTLTPEEISGIVHELDSLFQKKPYEEVFAWAKEKLEEYPSCRQLIWQVAVILDARRMTGNILGDEAEEARDGEDFVVLPYTISPDPPAPDASPDTDKYDAYICSLYERVLESDDESLRSRGADSLFGFYMRKKEYDKAEEYLQYFSLQNPERRRKQAQIYEATGRTQEAFRTWEELLFAEYGIISATLTCMYMSVLKSGDLEKAHLLADKQSEMAKCFEMGKYYEVSPKLELATMEKDAEAVVNIMQDMLSGLDALSGFRKSRLYEHMTFREFSPEFIIQAKKFFLNSFKDEGTFGFLKGDEHWPALSRAGNA